MDLKNIHALVANDLACVNENLASALQTKIPLIHKINIHVSKINRDWLRPLLVLLVAKAWGYQGTRHIDIAVIVAIIHAATHFHDDLFAPDESATDSMLSKNGWGNQAKVLAGDFLYARALQLLKGIEDMRYLEVIAQAVNEIGEGRMLALSTDDSLLVEEQQYRDIIYRKTASLFGSAAMSGYFTNNQDREFAPQMQRFGIHIGTSFQLVEDCGHFNSLTSRVNRQVSCNEILKKLSYPLILALQSGGLTRRQQLQELVANNNQTALYAMFTQFRATDVLHDTAEIAHQESRDAIALLECVPDSEYKDALGALARISAQLRH